MIRNLVFRIAVSSGPPNPSPYTLYDKQGVLKIITIQDYHIWEDYNDNFIINSILPSRLSPAFLATLPISLTSFVAFLPSNLMLSADVTVLATNSRSFPAEREGWSIVGSTASIGLLT